MDVKGRWTVTGACGPYNLGGSATAGMPRSVIPSYLALLFLVYLYHQSMLLELCLNRSNLGF